ncbi:hypothetical protein F5Y00DRAFT_128348 [Daldinia vernicosa]|uniref:uncharacterized protein n=1 Tax=Daldinia vernicosa TaxID=114800 RepID=UPI002007D13D|nr:uncharacterized protein F5Y00DRAFT_128348 [Daldinia vernicosa]KAI0846854.1 hypothetical protein F5Y00DRAFT_128348 [Daldinia vernicosa]
MKPEGRSSPSTLIFRIRVLDAVIEVPIKHDTAEGSGIEDAKELDLFHKPDHSASVSSSSNNDDGNNSPTHTTSIDDHTVSPLPRTSRSQDDFLALLTLLPVERYLPSPSSSTFSFCSAHYFDHDEGDAGKGKNNSSDSRSNSEEDTSKVTLGSHELLTTETAQS